MAQELPEQATIARPPTKGELVRDRLFRGLAWTFGWLTILVVVLLVVLIAWQASPAIQHYGLHFITSSDWDPGKDRFGILAEIWGTLYSSILGVALGSFF